MKKAFSLVELSIVLVILGLLVGGILAGQSLIRASELRSVGTELSNFQTSVGAFRDKYMALPGDMANATSFWGAVHTTPSTCRGLATSDSKTCNGDGNGVIASLDGVTSSENFHFWVHLANAGLVSGQYTGVSAMASPDINAVNIGANIPTSRLAGGGYTVWSCNNCWMATWNKNMFIFGTAVTNSYTYGGILTGAEAWNLDTKMDDGLLNSGRQRCSYNADSCNATYILTNSIKGANLLWAMN